jgi:hypothetical protein
VRFTQPLATFLALALPLVTSACGGGSSSAPTATYAVTPASTGSVTLSIKYPTTFHRALISSRGQHTTAAKRSTTSTSRSSQYVNPTAGDILQLYAYSQTTGYAPIGNFPIGSGTVGSDNSQTFSVNVAAGSYYYIYAIETDSNGNTLASGQTSGNVVISPGGAQALSLTMDMNAQYVVLTTDAVAGSDAVAISTSSSSPTAFCPASTTALYAFAADSQAGYVLPGTAIGGNTDSNGNLAIPTVQLTSSVPAGAISVQPVGFLLTTPANSVLGQFLESNPLGGTTFGYANIQGTSTTTCPNGSLDTNPIYTAQTATLTVSNGVAPYTVTTGDNTICTAASASPTTFTITANSSNAGTCPIKIIDANGTISAPVLLTVQLG